MANERSGPSGASQKRILVVDDNEQIVRALKMLLQYKGYWVSTAQDGVEGLGKAISDRPDVIILDIVMPIMDGYEVARRLARHETTRHIPIIILSVKGQVKGISPRAKRAIASRVREQMDGYEAGAVAFLSKPVLMRELLEAIESALMTRRSSLGG